MSHDVDDTYDVYLERDVVARKDHRCRACRETIARGDRYYRISIVFDGEASTVKRCVKCQAIHLHLRELGGYGTPYGDMWPDEELNCGEEYAEHWGHAPPAHIASLAFMTPADAQACRPDLWHLAPNVGAQLAHVLPRPATLSLWATVAWSFKRR